MGFLFPILLALGSLFLGELGGVPETELPWAVFALAFLPYVLVGLRRRAGIAGAFRRAALLSRLERLLPVLLQYTAIGFFGWMGSVEAWSGVRPSILAWPEPALLLALLPYVLYTLAGIDAGARAGRSSKGARQGLRMFQTRMFLTGLGPIVAYILLASLLGRWELLRVGVEEITLWSFGFTGILAACFVMFLPVFLRVTWDTERVPAGLQLDVLHGVARLADFRYGELLVWKTGNLMANAAIVGIVPGTRRVFFTDALMGQLGLRELAAVFAHEIGHAKRYHVLILLVNALAFFGVLDFLMSFLAFENELLLLGVLCVGLVVWLVVFGWLSRRIELEADLYSLNLLRDGIGITSALRAVAPASHDRGGWRHFSTNHRIAFLGRAAADPKVGERLHRGLVAVAGTALVVLVGTLGWRFVAITEAYPVERTVVDLRLGHYQAAIERRLDWSEGLEGERVESLAALVDQIAEAGLQPVDDAETARAVCTEQALLALGFGQTRRAEGWLALLGLLGDRQAALAAEFLGRTDGKGTGDLGDPLELGAWGTQLGLFTADQ